MTQYDAIAARYRRSKELPFRRAIERPSLFALLPDLRGLSAFDFACGEGHYSRLLVEAGAASVTGVDLSPAMIALARQQESRAPLGIRYHCADVSRFEPAAPADLVVAMYLLHYADSPRTLARFLEVIRAALKPGGRLVGFLDNVHEPPDGTRSWAKYSFDRFCRRPRPGGPREGDAIVYRMIEPEGSSFEFETVFWKPATYEQAFRAAGLEELRWETLRLHPSERDNPFWDDYLAHPPAIPFTAVRPDGR